MKLILFVLMFMSLNTYSQNDSVIGIDDYTTNQALLKNDTTNTFYKLINKTIYFSNILQEGAKIEKSGNKFYVMLFNDSNQLICKYEGCFNIYHELAYIGEPGGKIDSTQIRYPFRIINDSFVANNSILSGVSIKKCGEYFEYDNSGRIKVKGQYNYDKRNVKGSAYYKHGKWNYYLNNKKVKTEKYHFGTLKT